MSERDSVWRRADGVRVRMHVEPGVEPDLSAPKGTIARMGTVSTMTLTPFGAENDGALGEVFTLIGSVPVDEGGMVLS